MSETVTGYAGNKKRQEANKRVKSAKQPTQRKNKPKRKPIMTGPKSLVPAYIYLSECCDAVGKKVPCARKSEDKAENKKSESHLGVFRCSNCNGHSKFRRKSNAEGEAIAL